LADYSQPILGVPKILQQEGVLPNELLVEDQPILR
jgi:hypothetical protein